MADNDVIYTEMSLFKTTFGADLNKIAARVRELEAIYGGAANTDEIVKKACKEFGLEASTNALMASLVLATARAVAYNPKTYTRADYWRERELVLSSALHGQMMGNVAQAIAASLKTSLRLNDTWTETARKLYTGYGRGNIVLTQSANLPQVLQTAARRAIAASGGDEKLMNEYRKAAIKAQRYIDRLSEGGTPTKALKVAYQQALNATMTFSAKAIRAAIDTAVNEKGRYIAERIARTEISKAWGDSFLAEGRDDDDVIAFQWQLGSRHPKVDICDFHANANLYGLGKGVYPKNVFPVRPAHPHCGCNIRRVYIGELVIDEGKENALLDGASFDAGRAMEYIKTLDRKKLVEMFGVEGAAKLMTGRTEQWYKYLKGWQPHQQAKSWNITDIPTTPPKTPVGESNPPAQPNTPAGALAIADGARYAYKDTIAEVEKWANANLPIDYINFKKYPLDLANKTVELLDELYQRYPELAGKLKYFSTAQERNKGDALDSATKHLETLKKIFPGRYDTKEQQDAYIKEQVKKARKVKPNTWAEATNEVWGRWQGIGFNEKILTTKGYTEFLGDLDYNVKTFFHPVSCNTPASVVAHEFGHQIDYLLADAGLRAPLMDIWREWSRQSSTDREKTLSRYASKNDKEFIAEAFSEYICNPNPRPVAKDIGEAIEKAFQKMRGEVEYLKSDEYKEKLQRRGLL